jgi:coenzyme F420 hydrogenase subunit delta
MEFPEYCSKETVILGCGNILYGDDGFGPDVADYLISHYEIPDYAAVFNLGLSTRGFIFDILLSEQRPKRIVIVDAVTCEGKKPGQVFEVPLDNLCKEKVDDFSFHQGPTSNLLKELRDLCGLDVVIIAVQPESIPAEMKRGLSEPLKKAVLQVAALIYDQYLNKENVKYADPKCLNARC